MRAIKIALIFNYLKPLNPLNHLILLNPLLPSISNKDYTVSHPQ